MGVRRKTKRVKNITLQGKPDYSRPRLEYFIPCPDDIKKREISLCKGCPYWQVFGVQSKKVTSQSGKEAHEAVPTVECQRPETMPEEKMREYKWFYRRFYGKRPKTLAQTIDEVDRIIDQHLGHLPPHQRSEIE